MGISPAHYAEENIMWYIAEILTGNGCQRLAHVSAQPLQEAIENFKMYLPDGYTLVSVKKQLCTGFGELNEVNKARYENQST